MMVYGFDPGVTGAIALVSTSGIAEVADIPVTTISGAASVSRRIDARALRNLATQMLTRVARPAGEIFEGSTYEMACEAVHARVGDRNSMQSQGSLMRSLGAIEALCDVMGHPAVLVPPQTWQTFYGLLGKFQEQRGHGDLPAAVQLAAKLYPALAGQLQRVKDHNRAEALLIARYHLRKGVPGG